ncbi:LutC/YkgG family protein [Nigerium massiliense]|uniref:LutC/YkgG family protein n=1 Tax=Nigerium massiliense TaxID=1522317 RepID=UPI00058F7CB3|nr:LUD domain-containing protein [Nigerium massiliense]
MSENSSARDAVLGRIREALADVPADEPKTSQWTYGRPTAMPDVLDRFVERVADYEATVVRLHDGSDDAIGRALVEGLATIGVHDVVVPPGLPQPWRQAIADAGVEVVDDDPPLSRERLNAIGGVVTAARVGAAESGTIMLDHAADQGRRALTLVPDVHVCVVRADQVVSDVPEAVERLQDSVAQRRPITWVSGPSATSDIELKRVEGVHGPRTLYVIVAGRP